MATVKVKFRASSVLGKEGTLYYHLIHQRSLRWILKRTANLIVIKSSA